MGRAVSLAEKLLQEHKNMIDEMIIQPSSGGAYEISVNDEKVFSKLASGRYPGLGEVESEVRKWL